MVILLSFKDIKEINDRLTEIKARLLDSISALRYNYHTEAKDSSCLGLRELPSSEDSSEILGAHFRCGFEKHV